MEDILRQGGDRKSRRWPRLAVIVVLGAALTVAVVRHLPHGRADSHPGAARSAGAGQATGIGSAATAPPDGRDGITGASGPWQSGWRLPLAGARPAWLWPATGRTATIGRLPREPSGYVFLRVGGGWAIQPAPVTVTGCQGCLGPPPPVYFLADSSVAAVRVASAGHVAPAATSGALWLTGYRSGVGTARARFAREVSVTGAPLAPQVRLPAGYAIDQGTDRGLLLTPQVQSQVQSQAQSGRPGADLLWNPAARRSIRTFADVIAAGPHDIAWTQTRVRECTVHVLDLATGHQSAVKLRGASSAASGAFSPDGRYLALGVSFYTGGGALAMQLEVMSVTTGHLTVVPGTWVSSDALNGFGWPTPSENLVAELSFTTKVQVASWHPGAARLAVAPIRLGREPPALVVG